MSNAARRAARSFVVLANGSVTARGWRVLSSCNIGWARVVYVSEVIARRDLMRCMMESAESDGKIMK